MMKPIKFRLPVLLSLSLLTVCSVSRADILVNASFETVVNTAGELPTGYGYWRFDWAEGIGSNDGITPLAGERMLQFIYCKSTGPTPTGAACEVYQLVDMSSFEDSVSAGVAVAKISSSFNRILGDSETDTRSGIDIRAYAGLPNTFASQIGVSELGIAAADILTDADVTTWESIDAELLLPVNTDFLAIRLWSHENVFNDATAPEFDGHYADAVRLEIVPEPTTMSLLALGGLAILRRQKK